MVLSTVPLQEIGTHFYFFYVVDTLRIVPLRKIEIRTLFLFTCLLRSAVVLQEAGVTLHTANINLSLSQDRLRICLKHIPSIHFYAGIDKSMNTKHCPLSSHDSLTSIRNRALSPSSIRAPPRPALGRHKPISARGLRCQYCTGFHRLLAWVAGRGGDGEDTG